MINGYSQRKTTKGGWIACFLTITVLGGSLLLYGCGDSALQSSQTSFDEESTYFFDQPFYEDEFLKRDVAACTTYTCVEVITAVDGGVVLMDGAENLATAEALVVPEFSIMQDTLFTIEVLKIVTEDGDTPVLFEFQPDGLEFDKPAILRINACEDFGKKTEAVYLYRLDESTNAWILEAIAPVVDCMAVFEIPHFSRWGADGPPKGPTGKGGGDA